MKKCDKRKDPRCKKKGVGAAALQATKPYTAPQTYQMPNMPTPGGIPGMKCGGKVKHMKKGGTARGCGAATRGKKYTRAG